MIVLYSHKDFRHKDVERILMYKKCKNTMSKSEFCMCLQYTEYSLKANNVSYWEVNRFFTEYFEDLSTLGKKYKLKEKFMCNS